MQEETYILVVMKIQLFEQFSPSGTLVTFAVIAAIDYTIFTYNQIVTNVTNDLTVKYFD